MQEASSARSSLSNRRRRLVARQSSSSCSKLKSCLPPARYRRASFSAAASGNCLWHSLPALAEQCSATGIEFCCTPFYLDAVVELEPYVSFYKVASYELLWDDLLAACAKTGKPVVLSTGMATLDEIGHAVGVLRQNGCAAPTLLHCTSAYPTPAADANLAAIQTVREAFACDVGWSDHTVEPGVIMRAIHRWGARVIEFHFDLDGKGAEFGGGHCWLPDTIRGLIRDVDLGFVADGNPVKGPAPSELAERSWRADPHDGLRPLKETRKKLEQAKLQ